MFLDLNNIYKYFSYIIDFVNLKKTIKEELIHFDERDY